jgi:hypothetical protein
VSRSYRKTPIIGMTGSRSSEREFKRQEHQRERSHLRNVINNVDGDTDLWIKPRKKFGNPWSGPKDGKTFWSEMPDKFRRK